MNGTECTYTSIIGATVQGATMTSLTGNFTTINASNVTIQDNLNMTSPPEVLNSVPLFTSRAGDALCINPTYLSITVDEPRYLTSSVTIGNQYGTPGGSVGTLGAKFVLING